MSLLGVYVEYLIEYESDAGGDWIRLPEPMTQHAAEAFAQRYADDEQCRTRIIERRIFEHDYEPLEPRVPAS